MTCTFLFFQVWNPYCALLIILKSTVEYIYNILTFQDMLSTGDSSDSNDYDRSSLTDSDTTFELEDGNQNQTAIGNCMNITEGNPSVEVEEPICGLIEGSDSDDTDDDVYKTLVSKCSREQLRPMLMEYSEPSTFLSLASDWHEVEQVLAETEVQQVSLQHTAKNKEGRIVKPTTDQSNIYWQR